MPTTGLASIIWSASGLLKGPELQQARSPGPAPDKALPNIPGQPAPNDPDAEFEQRQPSAISCRACGQPVTNERFRLQVEGQHGHRVTNPHGIEFLILCFSQADGCLNAGHPYRQHSWFKGYQWQIALCRRCGAHMGWYFSQAEKDAFFTLIVDRITD
ncbi:MAG: hypothetical protein JKY89_10210 [Immundisolibacteraceae bacterium]|nr:hypothetical protein [Immundisolibacteraceae bacterium]